MTQAADAPPDATADAPPNTVGPFRGVRSLVERALSDPALAIADQAAVSGTRFVTTVTVGRFAGAEELGVYALATAGLILAGCVQESIVTKPYTVLRTGRGDRRYAGSALAFHLLFGLGLAGALLIAAAVCGAAGAPGAGLVLACLAGVAPLTLLWEFARRMSFAHLRFRSALAVDGGLGALQLSGLAALALAGSLNALTALAVVGAAAALAGGTWLALRRRQFAPRRTRLRSDWGRNWRFGRWVLAGQLCGTSANGAPQWILAATAGVAAAGLYAGAQNVVLLCNPLILAMASLLVPQTAEARRSGGTAAVRRVVLRAAALLAAVAGLFWLGLLLFGGTLLRQIYGAEFAGAGSAIRVLGLAPLAWSFIVAFEAGLSAIDRPDLSFRAILVGLIVTAAGAAALSGPFGPAGAAAGLALGAAVSAAVLAFDFLRLTSIAAAVPPESV
ncbi:oligosaccharide flippase family protein [Alienimonas californiensis]|uniref:MurJ-like flippase n=1 Tax=Alienimonas californiensis TaxID=2527989 RepID=A0A517P429_9PLAN|nr:oligosaccharide flippase family protein [Alienimonas californiensis]QDT14144.1 MurJ-like flippase [Alienimonas californiensis]